ncbi:MAG: hypothetical protein JO102_07850, partial [Elusimicrobia bacterium]|nr:hypothetical protein [Elusimicrobiota bacterium]
MRAIAAALSALLLFETVGVPMAEASQYSARRRTAAGAPQQFASLPTAPIQPISALTSALPPIARPSLSTERASSGRRSPKIEAVLAALPKNRIQIRSIHVGAADAPVTILIQDVHQNAEAQMNVAAALRSLFDAGAVGAVAVEGAFGPFDFTPFRRFDRPAEVERVAHAFVDGNVMGGPSYAGITSPNAPPFVGADDAAAYHRNVAAYLSARRQAAAVDDRLKRAGRDLATEKRAGLGDRIRPFDLALSAYQSGELNFPDYVQKLSELADATAPDGNIETDFATERFLEARRLERTLDFAAVEREQKWALEILARSVSDDEVKQILAENVAYRSGQIGFGDFYSYIKALCERKKVPLQNAPAFNKYLQYVLLADGIQADELFAAVRRMEDRIVGQAATPEEKTLLRRGRALWLADRMTRFELTPEEWSEFRGVRDDLGPIAPLMADFESFYREADIRSARMVEVLTSGKRDATALVAGGFHTPRLLSLLADKKASVVVLSPRLTRADNGTAYLSVFAREKTPLEKLFAGEKLFINPEITTVGAGGAARPYAAALMA